MPATLRGRKKRPAAYCPRRSYPARLGTTGSWSCRTVVPTPSPDLVARKPAGLGSRPARLCPWNEPRRGRRAEVRSPSGARRRVRCSPRPPMIGTHQGARSAASGPPSSGSSLAPAHAGTLLPTRLAGERPRTRKASRHQPATRREELLATRWWPFAARGFDGASVAEIGTACALGPGAEQAFSCRSTRSSPRCWRRSARSCLRRPRASRARGRCAGDAVGTLVDWHVDFVLPPRPLIVVQDRDRRRCRRTPVSKCGRSSGRKSTRGPAQLRRRTRARTDRARAMAHAGIGPDQLHAPHRAAARRRRCAPCRPKMALDALGVAPGQAGRRSAGRRQPLADQVGGRALVWDSGDPLRHDALETGPRRAHVRMHQARTSSGAHEVVASLRRTVSPDRSSPHPREPLSYQSECR